MRGRARGSAMVVDLEGWGLLVVVVSLLGVLGWSAVDLEFCLGTLGARPFLVAFGVVLVLGWVSFGVVFCGRVGVTCRAGACSKRKLDLGPSCLFASASQSGGRG